MLSTGHQSLCSHPPVQTKCSGKGHLKICYYFLQDVWLTAPGCECAPAGDSGHLVVIVGGGGGETDGADPVTEAHGTLQLDDGEVIVKRICDIVWVVNELAELIHT